MPAAELWIRLCRQSLRLRRGQAPYLVFLFETRYDKCEVVGKPPWWLGDRTWGDFSSNIVHGDCASLPETRRK